jgi:predicted MFS family arabinose efflux permease
VHVAAPLGRMLSKRSWAWRLPFVCASLHGTPAAGRVSINTTR